MYKIKSLIILTATLLLVTTCTKINIKEYTSLNRLPSITPDYINLILPTNIAPLNFFINEKGNAYYVEIFGKQGSQIVIKSNKPTVQINLKKWHRLLKANTGSEIYFQVYIRNEENKWFKYARITNSVANIAIDNHLAYRLINAGYEYWFQMGLYQRNLENFDESPIILSSSIGDACVNCHSFCLNNPQKMMLHIRKINPGTILINGASAIKINTGTDYTMSAGVYPSWHPSGKLIAFSTNIIGQNFASTKSSRIEVTDKASDLILYNIETNTVTTSPKISTKNRENLPTWSPDGKWLYYISAPEAKTEDIRFFGKYDLCRISYDIATNTWGDVDTVLTSKKTGLSISFPKISPDGKFLMFCMSKYGYFNIHHQSSDLYLMNLATREYHKMNVNSEYSESYHSWSITNRWFVFASRRLDGLYARPFISYIDENGNTSKPFVIPQRDPLFYDTFLKNYNLPELVNGKIQKSALELRDLAYTKPKKATFDTTVDIDALSGATRIKLKK